MLKMILFSYNASVARCFEFQISRHNILHTFPFKTHNMTPAVTDILLDKLIRSFGLNIL